MSFSPTHSSVSYLVKFSLSLTVWGCCGAERHAARGNTHSGHIHTHTHTRILVSEAVQIAGRGRCFLRVTAGQPEAREGNVNQLTLSLGYTPSWGKRVCG